MKALIEVEWDGDEISRTVLADRILALTSVYVVRLVKGGTVAGSNLDRTDRVPVPFEDLRDGDWYVGYYRGHRLEGEVHSSRELNYLFVGSTIVYRRNGADPTARFVEAWREKPALPTGTGTVVFGRVMNGGLSMKVHLMLTDNLDRPWVSSVNVNGRVRWTDDEITDWEELR